MIFKVDKDGLIRNLEFILETQEPDYSNENSTYHRVEDMLSTVELNPFEVSYVYLSEEDAAMLAGYFN